MRSPREELLRPIECELSGVWGHAGGRARLRRVAGNGGGEGSWSQNVLGRVPKLPEAAAREKPLGRAAEGF